MEKEKTNPIKKVLDNFLGIDEMLDRKVSKLGNSGHISVPSKHIGKNARVLILSDDSQIMETYDELPELKGEESK